MAKTVAELKGYCDVLNERVASARDNISDLWAEIGAVRDQLAKADGAVVREQAAHLKALFEELRVAYDRLAKLQTDHREEFVALRTQFHEHVKRYELWDNRRWAVTGLFIASALTLVANLLVIALRK